MLKQAQKYSKLYQARVESKTPGEILKKHRTQKVYNNKYPCKKKKNTFLKKIRKEINIYYNKGM